MSFATEDRRSAEAAVQALEAHGHSCWVAWRDIPEGVPYAAAIVQGIRGARVLVVLLTPESRSSQHVLREVECAVAANRPILSVQMGGCLPGEALAYYLSPTQWLRNDQTELDTGALVTAVGKLAKDAEPANQAVDHGRILRALIRNAFRFPVGVVLATGAVLAITTEALALLLRNSILGDCIIPVQNRSILLVFLSCFLSAGLAIEDAIERKRAPYHPLRGQLVPSYAVAAGMLLIFGLWAWSLAAGLSPAFLLTGSSPALKYPGGLGIPDFLTGIGDRTSFWWKIRNFSLDADYTLQYSALLNLIVFAATAMVLGSVALCIQRLARRPALTVSIIAMLPFLLVRWATGGVGGGEGAAPIYWLAPVCAALFSLWLRSLMLARWPSSPLSTPQRSALL